MKLSDLVQFLNYLDQYDLEETYVNSLAPGAAIAAMIQKSDCLSQQFKDPIAHNINLVDTAIQNFSESVKSLKAHITQQIVELEKPLLAASTHWFNTAMHDEDLAYVSNRKSVLTGNAEILFNQRLKIHTSWQHPGLIFRPMYLTALDDIVALDPMYLVDTDESYLTAITKKFTNQYQSRIRNYVIVNQQTQERFLAKLPNYQFGLVAAQDFFNYKPIEFINRLLDEIFCLLKPGGAFVFTYNNCDYAGAVKLAEGDFACYTPGRMIKQHAIDLGYVINFDFTEINGTGILELGKPGKKSSLRGGQTLAVIKEVVQETTNVLPIENKKIKQPKVIDNPVAKYYTDDERIRLQLSAMVLGIDTEVNIVNNYPIEKIDQLVTERLNTRDFNYDKFQKRLDKLIEKRKNT